MSDSLNRQRSQSIFPHHKLFFIREVGRITHWYDLNGIAQRAYAYQACVGTPEVCNLVYETIQNVCLLMRPAVEKENPCLQKVG